MDNIGLEGDFVVIAVTDVKSAVFVFHFCESLLYAHGVTNHKAFIPLRQNIPALGYFSII